MRGLSFLPFLAFATAGITGFAQTAGTTSQPAGRTATASRSNAQSRASRPAAARSTAAIANPAPEAPLVTNDEKTIYALGLSIFRSIGQFDLSPAELEIVKRALTDAGNHKPALDINEWQTHIPELAKDRGVRVAEKQRAAADAFFSKAAAEPGATRTPSGIIFRELRPGTGNAPKPTDTVKVNYRGTLVDGTEFDSSYARNEPASFPLNHVIPCWTEGLQLMRVGAKAQLVCPSNLAYGDRGQQGIPPGAALIFEVELLEISAGAPAALPPQP